MIKETPYSDQPLPPTSQIHINMPSNQILPMISNPNNPQQQHQQQPETQIPPQIQEIINPFIQFRRKLNFWVFVVIIVLMQYIQKFRLIQGDYWVTGLIVYFTGIGDNLLWIMGIHYGRQACNFYQIENFPKMNLLLKISLLFSLVNIVTYIHYYFLLDFWIDQIYVTLSIDSCLFLAFFLIRIFYLIVPATSLIQKIQTIQQEQLTNSDGNSLSVMLRNAIGVYQS